MTAGANMASVATAQSAPNTDIGGIEFRDVWLKDDEAVRRDAMELGVKMGTGTSNYTPEMWAKGLCVAAYDGSELVSIMPCEIRFAQRVRVNMAFLRSFVVPNHRKRGIVVPLTYKAHDVMRLYAVAHPEMRIGGTMGIVTAKGHMDEPVTKAEMVLIGYTPKGEPLVLRWFDHFKL
jgi:hypothetical protein